VDTCLSGTPLTSCSARSWRDLGRTRNTSVGQGVSRPLSLSPHDRASSQSGSVITAIYAASLVSWLPSLYGQARDDQSGAATFANESAPVAFARKPDEQRLPNME
jgi:hypothetical protein